jgi:hypothetical protein
MRVAVAVMVTEMIVPTLVYGFGRIAGRDRRSMNVLLHLEIFYAFERRPAAVRQACYAV